jgi:hypothetical protein
MFMHCVNQKHSSQGDIVELKASEQYHKIHDIILMLQKQERLSD